jgi:hypothetical protein
MSSMNEQVRRLGQKQGSHPKIGQPPSQGGFR